MPARRASHLQPIWIFTTGLVALKGGLRLAAAGLVRAWLKVGIRGNSRDDYRILCNTNRRRFAQRPSSSRMNRRPLMLFFYTRACFSAMLKANMNTLGLMLLVMLQTSPVRPQEVGVITGVISTSEGQPAASVRVFARIYPARPLTINPPLKPKP
jgi:hypothetical protein